MGISGVHVLWISVPHLDSGGGGGDILPVTSSFIYSQLSDAKQFSRVEERRGDD